MIPSQKSVIAIPATTNPSVACLTRPDLAAARTPSGTPTNTASVIDRSVSSMVTGSRCASSVETGVWLMKSCPKFPCSAPPAHVRYCATSGRSSPRFARTVATFSGVARNPSIVWTGSPGTRWIIRNTKMLIAMITGMAWNNRRTM
jgi:hypothetical protein